MKLLLFALAGLAAQSGNEPGIIGLVFEGYDTQTQTTNRKSVVVPLAVFRDGQWIAGETLQPGDDLYKAKEATLKAPLDHWNTTAVFYPISGDKTWELPVERVAVSEGIYCTPLAGFEGTTIRDVSDSVVAVSTVPRRAMGKSGKRPSTEEILGAAQACIARTEKDATVPHASPLGAFDDSETTYKHFDPSRGETPEVTTVTPFTLGDKTSAAWVVVEKKYTKRDDAPLRVQRSSSSEFTTLYHAVLIDKKGTWNPIWENGSVLVWDEWSPFWQWEMLGLTDANKDGNPEIVLCGHAWEICSYLALELDAKALTAAKVGEIRGSI